MTTALEAPAYVDLVPRELRRRWSERGIYPDLDLYAAFARQVAAHPDQPAVIDDHAELTYAELDELARRLASGLAMLGVQPGDVIGVQLPNGHLSCALDLAIAARGAIALPFPVGRGHREAKSLLGRSGAVMAIMSSAYAEYECAGSTRSLLSELPSMRVVVCADGAPQGCVPLGALIAADPAGFRATPSDPDGPGRILVTSGSEAEPKMVLYSHNALIGGRGRFLTAIRDGADEFRPMYLVPLASAFGSSATAGALAANGGTIVVQAKFDPASTFAMIERSRATHLLAVPTMIRKLLAEPGLAEHDLSSLRAAVVGGSASDADSLRDMSSRLGCPVINLYGSADGVNCHTVTSEALTRAGTVGRPRPDVAEIVVVDAAGEPVPQGEVGEILARGPMSPLQYVAAPELDARYRTSTGWTRTGDLGRFDEDGYLTVVGRSKDVIIRGGLNISPAEVEGLLLAHPAITDAVCVPVPDATLGDRLCACVVATEPLGLAEVATHLAAQGLDRRKFPEVLIDLDALPLGAAGKVDRRALQALAARHREEGAA